MSGVADVTNDDSPSEGEKEGKDEANTVEEGQSETLNVKKELLEEFPVEKQIEPKTVDKHKEVPLVQQFKGGVEGNTISNEIRSTYQKLLDVKEQVVDTEEFKNILAEAKNLILRVKGSQGASQDIEMYDLLCHEVEEMSKVVNTDQGKFHVEDNVLAIKFAPVALDTTEVEMTKELSHLPNELLRDIFLMLSPEDKKKAVLLNRRLGKVGEDPVLWKWCVIKITCAEDINKLSFKRFLQVQEISVCSDNEYDWQPQQLEELLKATLQLKKLKEIEGLTYMNLSSVNSELLATALSKLEDIYLYDQDHTTNDQRRQIFKQIAEKGLIKNLTVARIDLRPLELDAGVLAKAMSTLQDLDLRHVSLTSDQEHELFKAVLENNRLETVSLSSMDLSSVKGQMFGAALAKMEEVELRESNLTNEQVRLLFAEMSKNCKLNNLNLSDNDLSSVNPDVLATGVNNIEIVLLDNTRLTTDQISAILTKVQELSKKCKLNFLQLSRNDLSSVNPDVLATGVNNIERVFLNITQLTTDQISAILTKVQENSRLKRLDLDANDISEVDLALIERAKEIIHLFSNLDIDDVSEEDESDEDDDGSDEEADDGDNEEDIVSEEEEDDEDSVDGSIIRESDTELEGEKEMESEN